MKALVYTLLLIISTHVLVLDAVHHEHDDRVSMEQIQQDLASADVQGMAGFYADLLGLNVLMDQGWITTMGGHQLGPVQLSVASHGGSNTPVPDRPQRCTPRSAKHATPASSKRVDSTRS